MCHFKSLGVFFRFNLKGEYFRTNISKATKLLHSAGLDLGSECNTKEHGIESRYGTSQFPLLLFTEKWAGREWHPFPSFASPLHFSFQKSPGSRQASVSLSLNACLCRGSNPARFSSSWAWGSLRMPQIRHKSAPRAADSLSGSFLPRFRGLLMWFAPAAVSRISNPSLACACGAC